jgi:hypothetical protein
MDYKGQVQKNKRKMPLATLKDLEKAVPKDLVENNTVKQ